MNKKNIVLIVTISILSIGAGVYLYTQSLEKYTMPRTVRYSLTVQNTSNKLIESASIWVFGPVKQSSFQLTKSITASKKFELTTDELGNQILEFKIQNLPPFATKVITIQSQIMLADAPQSVNIKDEAAYLKAEPFVEVLHPDIQNKARQLSASSEKETLFKTYNWVSNHVRYAGYVKDDRGALYALKNSSGDCTEYAHLATALSRANKIPSRSVGGYIVKEDSVLRARDFHNWTEAYLNNQWRTIDAQNKRYMDDEFEYIIFRILGRSSDERLTNTHRFAYSNKKLKVTMK